MRITVFTPAYNRAYIIEKLYRSLQRQSFKDFEWVVVDDGSTDNTEELFARFCAEENSFSIHYVKTKNGGKHRAINRGVAMASGELFFIVDSDDHVTDDALEVIDRVEKTIPVDEKSKFAGICGQRGTDAETPMGSTFEGYYLDITSLEREQKGIFGEKAEVFYTQILKKYPFPEFEGEKFVTESVVWFAIASDGYLLRFHNDITIICNYLPDGLTAQGEELLFRNPRGYGLYLHQNQKFGVLSGMNKWNEYLRFYYALRDQYSFSQISSFLHMNTLRLWLRLFGMRLFYKFYDD